jgi:hypothetical protein
VLVELGLIENNGTVKLTKFGKLILKLIEIGKLMTGVRNGIK